MLRIVTILFRLLELQVIGTPPNFTSDGEPPATYVVDVQQGGNNLVLPCEVSGTSPITVSWFREGILIRESIVNEENNGTLSIRVTEAEANVAAPREGTNYHCEATNRIGLGNYNATLRSRNVNVTRYFFDDFESVEDREIQVGTIENGDVVLECDFTTSNPAPNITWFAIENMNIMVVEEDTTANNEILYLDGGRYLFIRALTSSERGRLYYCQVNNFLENGMPIRAPTTYSLNTDLKNEGITIYRELGTASGAVGETLQFVYAVAARDVNNTHIALALLCPENHPFLLFQPTGHIIAVEIKPEASNGDEIDFSCNVFGIGITTFARGTVIVPRSQSPARITIPTLRDSTLTNREHLVGGGPVEYSCEASGSPAPTITWYYNGAVVQSGSGGVVVGSDGTLTISTPQVSHSGIYQCFAKNQFGEDSRAWILEVRQPAIRLGPIVGAVIDRQVGYLIVADNGTELIISVMVNTSFCPTTPDVCDFCPSVQWEFNGMRVSNSTGFTLSDSCNVGRNICPHTFSLTIASFTSRTSGNYSAVFQYLGTFERLPPLFASVPVDGEVLGTVLEAESIEPSECLLDGSNITLTCIVTGFPRPEISFIKERQLLTPGQGSLFMDQIRIAGIDQTDEGIYTCSSSSNVAGPGPLSAKVVLCDSPTITNPMASENPTVGSALEVQCRVEGFPMPDITWNKDNTTLFRNRRHNIFTEKDVATLRIESAVLEDSGVYTCTASNVAGSTKMSVVVKVSNSGNIGAVVGGVVGGIVTVTLAVIATLAIILICRGTYHRNDKEGTEIEMQKNEVYSLNTSKNSRCTAEQVYEKVH